MANLDPKQLALQLKPQLEAKGYTVDPQGNVRYPPTGNGIHPPWAWMQAFPDADMSLKIPGSDPKSAWNSMYESGGPFSHGSRWDQENGTYKGGIDWGTLLGTIGVGGMFAAPAIAGALGAGGAGAGAGLGGVEAGATSGVLSGLPGAMSTLPALGGAGAAGAGGTMAGMLSGSLPGEMSTLPQVGGVGATLGSSAAPASYLAPSEFTMSGASPITGIVPNTVNGAVSSAAESAAAGGAAGGAAGSLAGGSGGNTAIPSQFGSSATDITASPLSSTAIPGGTEIGSAPGVGAQGALVPATSGISTTSPGAGGLMSKLLGKSQDISSLLGGLQQGIKNDRSLEGIFSQNFDKNSIEAQTAANQARAAALKQLAQSNYIKSGGANNTPTSLMMNGTSRQVPTFGTPPKAPSAQQIQGATDLGNTAAATLAPGGTYTPQPLSNYATPGTGEKLASAGSTIAGLLPTIGSIFKMF